LIAAWREAPDLVLFDPAFADLPDKEFIQKLRNDPSTSTIPLVALSTDQSTVKLTKLSGITSKLRVSNDETVYGWKFCLGQ